MLSFLPILHGFTQNETPLKKEIPLELQFQILRLVVLPEEVCIKHVFAQCNEGWTASHKPLSHDLERRPVFTPPLNIVLVNKHWYEEAYKFFFANHTFVFNTRVATKLHGSNHGYLTWRQERDPWATRILDFVDTPSWKDKGSETFQRKFPLQETQAQYVNLYRHTIRKLVIRHQPNASRHFTNSSESDWDWVMKVDFQTLPYLEEVTLDWGGLAEMGIQDEDPALFYEFNEGLNRLQDLEGLRVVKMMNIINGEWDINGEWEMTEEEYSEFLRNAFPDNCTVEVKMVDAWTLFCIEFGIDRAT